MEIGEEKRVLAFRLHITVNRGVYASTVYAFRPKVPGLLEADAISGIKSAPSCPGHSWPEIYVPRKCLSAVKTPETQAPPTGAGKNRVIALDVMGKFAVSVRTLHMPSKTINFKAYAIHHTLKAPIDHLTHYQTYKLSLQCTQIMHP